ncbi:alpha/beta hydrolase [Lignipirellula cremea]|uniref:Acetylxylan esterase n=1 Tax=Lignipirellula cremea TaxID=2528010 RepID=A0A518E1K2_9BACT|nr:alpha/beta hydrolase [Lignipirellula cremea]QDU97975.1 Acetylxylan esterase precursor [Lignipirellula cremea]
MKHLSLLVPVVAGLLGFCLLAGNSQAADPLPVWPDLAPGETLRSRGDIQPYREADVPPITRVTNIRQPTFTVHLAAEPNGAGVLILPGGGFGKVVPDLEGTEAAAWLNGQGISAFVLNYRTKIDNADPGWERALQDAQRALSLLRSQAKRWGLQPDRIGLLGFSAGGQVAARLLTDGGKRNYERIDAIDDVSHRPDFALLVYPWKLYDASANALTEGMVVPADCPPAFIVHTDDDHSSSLGAVLFYAGLKKQGVPAELHVYGNGGHGYGLRDVKGSQISSWTGHAAHWLERHAQAPPTGQPQDR